MAVDIRGFGETSTSPWRYVQTHGFTGHDVAEFYIALMLGKSFVGTLTEDISAVAKYIMEKDPSPRRRIHVVAWGNASPPTLHAIMQDMLINVVPGAMEYYDLPDLAGMVPAEKIRVVNPR